MATMSQICGTEAVKDMNWLASEQESYEQKNRQCKKEIPIDAEMKKSTYRGSHLVESSIAGNHKITIILI